VNLKLAAQLGAAFLNRRVHRDDGGRVADRLPFVLPLDSARGVGVRADPPRDSGAADSEQNRARIGGRRTERVLAYGAASELNGAVARLLPAG
jgi:hypothetical protein